MGNAMRARASRRGPGWLVATLAVAFMGVPGPVQAQATPPAQPLQVLPPGVHGVVVDQRLHPPRGLRGAKLQIRSTQTGEILERAIEAPSMAVMLPPGTFDLEVHARRHTARMTLHVTPRMGPVDVHLTRRGSDGESFARNKGLLGGFALAGLLHLGVGATVLLVGAVREERATRRNEGLLLDGLVDAASAEPGDPTGLALVEASYPTTRYHHDLARAMNLELAGTAVLAGSFGVLGTAALVENRGRRRAAWIALGVGAAMAAGGSLWIAVHLDDRADRLAESDPTRRVLTSDLRPLVGAQTGAAALTGLGGSLVIYPLLALLSDRVKRRRDRSFTARVTPALGRGHAGLALHGRF